MRVCRTCSFSSPGVSVSSRLGSSSAIETRIGNLGLRLFFLGPLWPLLLPGESFSWRWLFLRSIMPPGAVGVSSGIAGGVRLSGPEVEPLDARREAAGAERVSGLLIMRCSCAHIRETHQRWREHAAEKMRSALLVCLTAKQGVEAPPWHA